MKIVVFEAAPHGASVIERRKEQHDVRIVAEPLHAANVADAEVISTFIYSTLDRAVLGSQDVRFTPESGHRRRPVGRAIWEVSCYSAKFVCAL